jgi:hypothetical protein
MAFNKEFGLSQPKPSLGSDIAKTLAAGDYGYTGDEKEYPLDTVHKTDLKCGIAREEAANDGPFFIERCRKGHEDWSRHG